MDEQEHASVNTSEPVSAAAVSGCAPAQQSGRYRDSQKKRSRGIFGKSQAMPFNAMDRLLNGMRKKNGWTDLKKLCLHGILISKHL